MSKDNVHTGHRARLRERVRQEGLAAFSDHEVLELLLTYAIPRRDVNPLAHELVARFGSLAGVLEADESELLRVEGMGGSAAQLLSMIPQLTRRYQLSTQGKRPVIANLAQASAYCAPLFVGVHREHLYMICLSKSGHVLHLTLLHTGTIDEVALYPRIVVQTALRYDAHAVLLAHNHPGGLAEPSQADYRGTEAVLRALDTVGIKLLDHLIFCDGQVYSITRSARAGAEPEAVRYVAGASRGEALCEGGEEWIALEPDTLNTQP